MGRVIAALKWLLLFAGTIAATFGYLTVCDRFGFGRAGRWVLTIGSLVVAVGMIAWMVREDIREEDERFKD